MSPQDTQNLLQHNSIQKSTGPDGFSGRFLKEIVIKIVEPLTKLYKYLSTITPVHISGPKYDPSNFF